MKNNNPFEWLQSWFYKNCNNEWEHNTNVKIMNLDNPGWSIFINLKDTNLEDKVFQTIKDYRTESSWIYCTVEDNVFKSACGPFNLIEALQTFQDWVESNPD